MEEQQIDQITEILTLKHVDFGKEVKQAFFDIRVFDSKVCRYLNKYLKQSHAMHEQEKKRSNN